MSKFKPSKPKIVKIMYKAIQIPQEMYSQLKRTSKKRNMSIRSLVIQMIQHCLKDMGVVIKSDYHR